MAISKAVQDHFPHFELVVHRVLHADVPAPNAYDVITLREKSKDDPPSPPPQPPPSPANWTLLPKGDYASMASVGTCTTSV